MKISRKEERLSPEIPISATNAAGSAVRHKAMIRAVRLRGSNEKTGTPMANARMPASITFRALNIPPKKVPDVIFCERKEWIGIEERSSA